MMNDQEMIDFIRKNTSQKDYLAIADRMEELVEDVRLLDCLRSAGVDNWEGFEFAIELLEEDA